MSAEHGGPARAWSLLPDEDAETAYCATHSTPMEEVQPLVYHDGATYILADDFHFFYCPGHLREVGMRAHYGNGLGDDVSDAGTEVIRAAVLDAFEFWDAGEAPAEWFVFEGDDCADDADGAVNLFPMWQDLDSVPRADGDADEEVSSE